MSKAENVLTADIKGVFFSKDTLSKIGEYVVKQAKMETILNAGGKATAISEKISYEIDEKNNKVIINVDSPYATALEFGSKPHVIKPKPGKKLLSWEVKEVSKFSSAMDKKLGDWFYFKSVKHPGSQPQPFLRKAIQKFKLNASEILNSK